MTSREIARRMKASRVGDTLPDGTKTVASKCSVCGAHNVLDYGFCWRCGSPLTDEAVDLLAKRLEALKDGSETD